MTVLEYIENLPEDTRFTLEGDSLKYLYLFETVGEAIRDNEEYLTHEIINVRESDAKIMTYKGEQRTTHLFHFYVS